MSWTHKSNQSSNRVWHGKHRREHWYRDNQVYFITARCRGKFPAFADDDAKLIFWERFERATTNAGFKPWVTSLLDNHYHTLGYLPQGLSLPRMMRTLHGVAKLVNDILQTDEADRIHPIWHDQLNDDGRLLPFWRDSRHNDYFDGCLRDERQGRRTYRYVLLQSERHGMANDHQAYPHTRVDLGLEEAIAFANQRGAWLEGVRYKRYEE